MLRAGPPLERADGALPFGRLDRQIAVKGERLPVEPRGHHRKDNRRGAHERHHADAAAVARLDHQRPGVGHARHTSLGNHAGRAPLLERPHQLLDLAAGGRMFVQFAELQLGDGAGDACLREEAPRRADVLDDEVVERIHHGPVGRGEHLPGCRFVRDGTGNQVKRALPHGLRCHGRSFLDDVTP